MNEKFSTLRVLGGSKEVWHEVVDTMFELMSADVNGHDPKVSQDEMTNYILFIGTLIHTDKDKIGEELDRETELFKRIVEDGKLVFRDMEQAKELLKEQGVK